MTLDELQEAVLFPYLVEKPAPPPVDGADAPALQPGTRPLAEGPGPIPELLLDGDELEGAEVRAARQAAVEVGCSEEDEDMRKAMFQAALLQKVGDPARSGLMGGGPAAGPTCMGRVGREGGKGLGSARAGKRDPVSSSQSQTATTARRGDVRTRRGG